MAKQDEQGFRWRTVVEVGVIAAVIYVVLGAPGAPLLSTSQSTPDDPETSTARPKEGSLVAPDAGLQCQPHAWRTHVFSSNPLMLYVDGFLSKAEADHLVDISSDKWEISTVWNEGAEVLDEKVRKSEKALIDRDETVQCIEQRALSIQGWPQDTFIERLWTQRYNVTGHYAYHYDWATASKKFRRVSSYMVYLGDECTGGGTQFPRISRPADERWCEFIECDGVNEGTTFKPRKGSAVFWQNFDADGKGHKDTIHAGLPVQSGTKIGLNIWSWYQAGHRL